MCLSLGVNEVMFVGFFAQRLEWQELSNLSPSPVACESEREKPEGAQCRGQVSRAQLSTFQGHPGQWTRREDQLLI